MLGLMVFMGHEYITHRLQGLHDFFLDYCYLHNARLVAFLPWRPVHVKWSDEPLVSWAGHVPASLKTFWKCNGCQQRICGGTERVGGVGECVQTPTVHRPCEQPAADGGAGTWPSRPLSRRPASARAPSPTASTIRYRLISTPRATWWPPYPGMKFYFRLSSSCFLRGPLAPSSALFSHGGTPCCSIRLTACRAAIFTCRPPWCRACSSTVSSPPPPAARWRPPA